MLTLTAAIKPVFCQNNDASFFFRLLIEPEQTNMDPTQAGAAGPLGAVSVLTARH